MEEYWDKLAEKFAGKSVAFFEAWIFPRLEKFFRAGVKLSFSEAEAASLLNIEKSTLAEIRRRGEINYYQFGKSPVYGLQHLQEYLARHEVKNVPALYTVKKEISLFGAETEVKLRKVG